MSNLATYVDHFFEDLEVFEDIERGHNYKAYLRTSAQTFLEHESPGTAYAVYRAFFDSYRVQLRGAGITFLDLLDILRSYEETAATLIDKQRDHYVHSVNVFLTGLAIWAECPRYRTAFLAAVPEAEYREAYQTAGEEFFYRWGIASLFHDVGYPVEIIGNQLNRFMRLVADADGAETRVRARISYENFPELNHIKEIIDRETFARTYREAYPSCAGLDLLAPLDLLAHRIHRAYGCDLAQVKAALDGAVETMAASGFIDHGYYSALIVLKWYGYAIQQAKYLPEYFYWPILDSACAIFLHNWYRNGLTKDPFNLGPMHASDNPIAWLLILCDELQEWNRAARGIITRTFTLAETVHLSLSDGYLASTYVTRHGKLPAGFCAEKVELLRSLLALDEVFPLGFDVDNESLDVLGELSRQARNASPRPAIADLELLAIAIHASYNERQLQRHPERPLDYPDFSTLPDDLKYSNLRQAQSMYDHLERVGLTLGPAGREGALDKLPDDFVEAMARDEHDAWMRERLDRGWKLGPRDVAAKTSPYLVPYDEVPDEIQELDRDAVRNIPALARRAGMAVYVQ